MAVEADAQEILDYVKHWVRAVNLCTTTLPKLTAQGLLDSVEFFENGGRFTRSDRDRD